MTNNLVDQVCSLANDHHDTLDSRRLRYAPSRYIATRPPDFQGKALGFHSGSDRYLRKAAAQYEHPVQKDFRRYDTFHLLLRYTCHSRQAQKW